MLQPNRRKYRKDQKGRNYGLAQRGANVSFGGTSIIIVVGVVIETLKQVESLMRVRYYKGFLND